MPDYYDPEETKVSLDLIGLPTFMTYNKLSNQIKIEPRKEGSSTIFIKLKDEDDKFYFTTFNIKVMFNLPKKEEKKK